MMSLLRQPPWVWRMATMVAMLFLCATLLAFSVYLGGFHGRYGDATLLGFASAFAALVGFVVAAE